MPNAADANDRDLVEPEGPDARPTAGGPEPEVPHPSGPEDAEQGADAHTRGAEHQAGQAEQEAGQAEQEAGLAKQEAGLAKQEADGTGNGSQLTTAGLDGPGPGQELSAGEG